MSNHRWKFFRAGGVDQVALESAKDLIHLDSLDQKLWVALSCPTKGVEFDTRTLELIDADKDGRIRAPDMIAAVKWAIANLKDPEILLQPSEALALNAINDSTEEGRRLLSSARQILINLGKEPATITAEDTADTAKVFSATKFNGDGIVPFDATPDETVQQAIKDIIDSAGPELDRTGNPGISQEKADLFFKEANAFSDWNRQAEAAGVLTLGESTGAAMIALEAVRTKIEDFFVRCRLAAFDHRAVTALNRPEEEYLALAAKDLSEAAPEMVGFPLAHIEAGRTLPLGEGVNPAWSTAIAKFRDIVVHPILGAREELTEKEWAEIKGRFEAFRAWQSSKAGALVEKLGLVRVREILVSDAQSEINALIAKDKALEPEMNAITGVDRLVRYHRDLYTILKNFVSFADFYSAKQKAIFQAGRLYLDARSCDLCIRVPDIAKHAIVATLGRTYLAYCECTRRGGTDKMIIAAAFTGGDSDHLMVGRNGIFYDRDGNDWDASIVRVLEHPISLRQAIMAPYKRFGKMVNDQIEKLAASRDKAITDKAAATISAQTKVIEPGAHPAPPAAAPAPAKKEEAFDAAKFAGIFAAISLAVAGLGAAVGQIVTGFLKLTWWQMPLAFIGVFVAVSGPSALLAFLKLRQRNLGPILDACGWAVNGRMKINIPFGAALTCTAKVPPHSLLPFKDPFAEKKSGRFWTWFFVALFIFSMAAFVWWNKKREKREDTQKSTTIILTNSVTITNVPSAATNIVTVTNASASSNTLSK
jgi:hypothetical protein